MSSTAPGTTPHYFVPQPSRHPAMGAFGLFFVIFGAANWINGMDWASTLCSSACCGVLGPVRLVPRLGARERRRPVRPKIDISYRWSMSWFIFSEVMFFGAFFTALWWMRSHSVPALGSADNALLWPALQGPLAERRSRRHGPRPARSSRSRR